MWFILEICGIYCIFLRHLKIRDFPTFTFSGCRGQLRLPEKRIWHEATRFELQKDKLSSFRQRGHWIFNEDLGRSYKKLQCISMDFNIVVNGEIFSGLCPFLIFESFRFLFLCSVQSVKKIVENRIIVHF
jgi:hypothetical protein